jgi:alkylation response protein AidB-like acyl-CoA dehydrogenase
LTQTLSKWAPRWNSASQWPQESLRLCAQSGVYRWFMPREVGGLAWSDADQTLGYLRLAQADLTTTFIITQYMGACRRIAGSGNTALIERWMTDCLSGEAFATVGISHLTTSRQHVSTPVLLATPQRDGWRLDGMSPWVTGAAEANVIVVGATLADGRELLAAVPNVDGVRCGEGVELMALSASKTDQARFDGVHIDPSMLIAGPIKNVMSSGSGAGTGGLQTSTLAVGLTRAAIEFLKKEATNRHELVAASDELYSEVSALQESLLAASSGAAGCDATALRAQANRLVLRATQAALVAAKGAGYVDGHPVGRWCREAMFFLVWSCPQPISQAHLCELAGIT